MVSAEVDWASLHQDLLLHILGKLLEFSDYVRFMSVCQQWRHAASEGDRDSMNKTKLHILRTCHNELPMVMFQSTTSQDTRVRDLISLGDGYFYRLVLPWPCGHNIAGSSQGWLFVTGQDHHQKGMFITLLNPFTTRTVRLPRLVDPYYKYSSWIYDAPYYFITKGIVSSNPLYEPFEVVVIYGSMNRLACFRSGTPWKFVRHWDYRFHDVIYFKGYVYAVTCYGDLVEVDFNYCSTRQVVNGWKTYADIAYLVISKGLQLIMVQQFLGKDYKTRCFKVFVLSRQEDRWCEIKDLGKQALFVGNNQSVCVSTLEYPKCLANHIYFTDYSHSVHLFRIHESLGEDHGVFSIEYGKIEFPCVPETGVKFTNSPPLWIVPNLNERRNYPFRKSHSIW